MFDESFDAEPSTPRPIGDARRLEIPGRADPLREQHVGGGAVADADSGAAEALDLGGD